MQNLKTVDFGVAFTLTRPAPADYEDKDGNTQTAAANEPRFNYSNGVAQGLMLDASLSETAAIDDVPAFNASAGHWIIDAEFYNSEPLKGMGLNGVFTGSGKMVVSYSGGTAKVWSGGQAIYTVASYTPMEPTHICEGGMATIGGLTYKPSAISDADAAALATGDFELVPFAPDELFANGEKGAWYDPSDLTTLFQDSAGITPVTADGDPVGLMLDKRLGLVRGPEQSANPGPDYASLTGFTATNGNLSIVDGHVRLTGNGGISRVTISETLTVGKTYNVMIRARSSSPGARMFFWSGVEPSIDSGVGSIGSEFSDFSCIVKATSENVDVRAYIDTSSATAGYTLDIASISIKELPGNHASQSTTAAKPTFRTDGTLYWLEFDGDDDALVASIPSIANATAAIAKSTGTEITYPVDLSGGEFVMDETNYGVIVREGEFTEQEALDVTTYLNAKAGIES